MSEKEFNENVGADVINHENIKNQKEKFLSMGFSAYKEEKIDYVIEGMNNIKQHNYVEYQLALFEYMVDYKVSDLHLIINYGNYFIGQRIGGILFPINYKIIREYIYKWLLFRSKTTYGDVNDEFINQWLGFYDLFFGLNTKDKDYSMNILFDDLSKEYLDTIADIIGTKENIRLNGKNWLLNFLININQGSRYVMDANDESQFQSLRFTLQRLEEEKTENGESQEIYKDYDYRIQAVPVKNFNGLFSFTIRLLSTELLSIDQLGYDEFLPLVKNSINRKKAHRWCGETNSGKSTAMVSAEKYLIDKAQNEGYYKKVIKIEDPIEKKVPRPGVEQVEVEYNPTNINERKTFSDAVRSAMREDPDVISVGETRDLDTGSEALTSAITGHIVLSTIHINNSFAIFKRLSSLKPSAYSNAGGEGIEKQKILNGLGLVITTDLLTTYPIEKTLPLKDLISKISDKNGNKMTLYEKYYQDQDDPIIKEIYEVLLEVQEKNKIEGTYPLLTKIFNEFKKFSNFYYNNIYIDFKNKKDIFTNFNKWFLYTVKNFRIPFKHIQSEDIGRQPVIEILDVNSDLISQLEADLSEKELFEWMENNENTFLPRFYYAYIKNLKLINEKEKTLNFKDITDLALLGYTFRIE